MKKTIHFFIINLLTFFGSNTYAQPGTLISNFGNNGVVISPVMQNNLEDNPRAITITSDDKIVTTGYSSTFDLYHAYIAKYNIDGSFDTTFGSNGKVISSESFFTQYTDIISDEDGKIVVCGVKTPIFSSQGHDCFVARFNANGTPDTTFGSGGQFTTALSTSTDGLMRILKLADGRYITLARFGSGAAGIAALIMLTPNGNLDSTFGNGGIKTHLFSSTNPQGISDLVIADDGNILALGGGDGVVKLAKFNLSGNVVSSFGNNGTVVVPTGRHLRVLADGSLLVMGEIITGQIQMTAYKYLSNGTIDTSFGSGGTSLYSATGMTNVSGFASRPLIYPDGKFMRGWRHTIVTNGETKHKTAITWFNADGSVSNIGETIHDINPNPNEFSSQMPEHIIMDGNGDVFSLGYIDTPNESKQFVMKFKGDMNLGTQELNVSSIKVYPNPFTDKINFDLEDSVSINSIELFDSLGKKVSIPNWENNQIQLAGLALGLYILKVSTMDNQQFSFKVIKK